jgi:hypothetical protein
MKSIRVLKRRVLPACVTAGLVFSNPAQADDFDIDATFSGIWSQPNHQNQGFLVQISNLGDDRRLGVVYWFTYGEDSQPDWYYMVGDVDDNEIEGALYKTLDIAFLEPFSESDDEDGNGVPDDREDSVVEIGEMIVSFDSCNSGLVGWDTDDDFLGEGEVEIERLITVEGLECDEEDLFDDDDDDEEADDDEDDDSSDDDDEEEEDDAGSDTDISASADLENTGVLDEAGGYAEYSADDDEVEFEVEIHDVPAGLYPVFVGDTEIGVIEAESDDGGDDGDDAEGEIEFSDPQEEGSLPLPPDFDPLGQNIRVFHSGEVILEAVLVADD